MDLDDFLDFIERVEENEVINRIPKRYIRDVEDPFTFYRDVEFRRRYRFPKVIVRDTILPLVTHSLMKNNNRGLPIAPVIQLLASLRYYATGHFQIDGGDLRGISQASMSFIIKRVSIALAEHLNNFIHFPDADGQQENIRKFHTIAGFPNVAACVDGTHISILNPGGDIGEIFRNRKGQFSLNVQVACGPNMEILDIVVRHPGSTHDNTIFAQSALRILFEENQLDGIILGDNGYGCKRYLLTPVLNPSNVTERNYNRAHRSTRNIVERVFGIWKRRFPCLKRTLNTKLETSATIICATAVLHNIGRQMNDIFEDEEAEDVVNIAENIIFENIDNNVEGLAFRRAFIQIHF